GAARSPYDHSAATTAEPPVVASLTVAVRLAGCPLSIGSGLACIEPAPTSGPCVSPPVRAIANVALLTSAALSAGLPLSSTVTRTSACEEFGTDARFHTYGDGLALFVSVVQDWPPSSEYSMVRLATVAGAE